MNIVELIDVWIDARIAAMSDDEVDTTLQILDDIAAHELAEFNTAHVRDDEFDALINQFDESRQHRAATMIVGGLDFAGRTYVPVTEDDHDSQSETEAKLATEQTLTGVDDAAYDDLLVDPDLRLAAETERGRELAPRFLGSTSTAPPPNRARKSSQVIVTLTLLGSLIAFGLGGWSLYSSLDVATPDVPDPSTPATAEAGRPAPDDDAPTNADETETASPGESEASEAENTNDRENDGQAGQASEAEEPIGRAVSGDSSDADEPSAKVHLTAVVLDDKGAVHALALDAATSETPRVIYEAAPGAPLAAKLRSWDNRLAILTEDGGVRIDDLASTDQPLIWDTNNFPAALDAAIVDGTNVILTSAGTVVTFSGDVSPNVDEVQTIWEESPAAAIETNGTTLLVLLEQGDVMVWSNLESEPERLWAAEGEPRALTAQMTSDVVVVGLDGGRLRMHNLDPIDTSGEELWAGSAEGEPWALAYAASETRTAIVLDSYEVIVIDDDDETLAWDGSEGLPAPLDVAMIDEQLLVLLETGSVVQVSATGEAIERSVWDVSSETSSPARQPLLIATEDES